MKRHNKQFLAVLLALLILASMSLVAFAAADEGEDTNPPESIQVTFNAGEGAFSDGSTSKTVTATYTSVAANVGGWALSTPDAPTCKGKIFSVWENSSDGPSLGAGASAMIMNQAHTTYTAKWVDKGDYTITFDANGGMFSDGEATTTVTATYNSFLDMWTFTPPEAPATQPEGKGGFTKWSGGGSDCIPGNPAAISTQITSFTAVWKNLEHKITFDTEHGTKPSDMETVDGKLPDLPKLTASGYTFKGWFVGDQEYKGGETITENITLTAKWVKNPSQSGGSGILSGGSSTPSYSVGGGSGAADNGSWTTDKASAQKGDTVTITLKPRSGYQGVPAVKDDKGNSVTVTRKDENVYTFIMPEGNVTISAEFTAIVQPIINPFVDVSEGDYYYDAVLWALENLITQGTGDGTTFSPDKSCTRAEAVTFLWRAAGEPEPTTTVNPFTDVEGGYYYKAMLWAVENKITTGTGDGTTFSPGAVVSRGQMVTFLWRVAGEPSAAEGGFTDISANEYYAAAVNWAASNGITQGYNGAFSPNDNCTRGHIVTFLYRAQ